MAFSPSYTPILHHCNSSGVSRVTLDFHWDKRRKTRDPPFLCSYEAAEFLLYKSHDGKEQ